MRPLKLALVLAVLSSPAFADRRAADACASGLPKDSAAIYAAAVGRMGPGVDGRAIVKGVTMNMVNSGQLSAFAARGAATAAGGCLKKLKDDDWTAAAVQSVDDSDNAWAAGLRGRNCIAACGRRRWNQRSSRPLGRLARIKGDGPGASIVRTFSNPASFSHPAISEKL